MNRALKLLRSTYYIFFLYFVLYFVLYLVVTTCGVMPQVLRYHRGFQHHGLYIKPAGVTCTCGNGVCMGVVWQVTGVVSLMRPAVSPVLHPRIFAHPLSAAVACPFLILILSPSPAGPWLLSVAHHCSHPHYQPSWVMLAYLAPCRVVLVFPVLTILAIYAIG